MQHAKRIWHGIAWHSEERFTLTEEDDAIIASGDLAGETEDGQLFVINYSITLSPDWDVQNVSVQDGRNGRSFELVHKLGRWYDGKGVLLPQFDGVEFIDLSLTPFTNALPIKTLDLADAEPEEIETIFIDLPNFKAERVTQIYTKVGPQEYQFEDRQTEFEGHIHTDDQGLPTHYEGLFEAEA